MGIDEEPPRLIGTMTGASNDVLAKLLEIKYPPNVRAFLDHLTLHTFAIAHMHREWKHDAPGSWCHFDLGAWAAALKLQKPNVIRVRNRLVEDGVIVFEPDEADRGRGRVAWNLDYSQWKPLQGERRSWGGKRSGAGRKIAQADIINLNTTSKHYQLEKINQVDNGAAAEINQVDNDIQPSIINLNLDSFSGSRPEAAPTKQADLFKSKYVESKNGRTETLAELAPVLPIATPPMPSSGPKLHTYEEMLDTLRASAGWKGDAGKDLLLVKHLQHYPIDWLYERAGDYALADGLHNYNGFKNWCASPRCQEKLRLWEQEQAKKARAAASPSLQVRSRQEQEAEEDRIIAERNARSRARFGLQGQEGR